MPHQCTNCSLTFEDGSKQMLGGCPECGGNKFQFLPKGKASGSADDTGGPPDLASSPPTATSSAPSSSDASTPASASSTASSSTSPSSTSSTAPPDTMAASDSPADENADDIIEAPAEPIEAVPGGEDRAQASARRDVVSEDELPVAESNGASEGCETKEAQSLEDERPGLAQLRQELNDQFESIKILRPGEYELNLMELYDRQEYIIALEEDGRYVIDVPDTWRDDD